MRCLCNQTFIPINSPESKIILVRESEEYNRDFPKAVAKGMSERAIQAGLWMGCGSASVLWLVESDYPLITGAAIGALTFGATAAITQAMLFVTDVTMRVGSKLVDVPLAIIQNVGSFILEGVHEAYQFSTNPSYSEEQD